MHLLSPPFVLPPVPISSLIWSFDVARTSGNLISRTVILPSWKMTYPLSSHVTKLHVITCMYVCMYVSSEFLRRRSGCVLFWAVAPCSLVGGYQCFGEICCLRHQEWGSRFLRNVVTFCEATRYPIAKNRKLNILSFQNLLYVYSHNAICWFTELDILHSHLILHEPPEREAGIASGWGWPARIQCPAGARDFSLHQNVQKGSGSHPCPLQRVPGLFPPKVKAAGAWSWPVISI
jgi:hypothetical protein